MATLARLIAHGVSVPPAFVITTECGELEDAEVEAAIGRAYDDLATSVAVRSSALAEDTGARSAAGLFSTVLDVVGLKDLLSSIARCRSSATSDHVRAYLGDAPAATHMAVGVMAMVQPEVSGVTFTRSPLGADHMLVEAVRGPLQPLVDGTVIPEHLDVRPEQRRILRRVIGEHGVDLLDEASLVALVDTCLKIREVIGVDVDVEWAFRGGELFVLQARPVTSSSLPA